MTQCLDKPSFANSAFLSYQLASQAVQETKQTVERAAQWNSGAVAFAQSTAAAVAAAAAKKTFHVCDGALSHILQLGGSTRPAQE